MKINWVKVAGAVALVLLVGFILYGSYRFYFDKPQPVIQNTTVQPGGVANIGVAKKESKLSLFNEVGLQVDTHKEVGLYYRFGIKF